MAISGIKDIITTEKEEDYVTLSDRSDEFDVRKENAMMRDIVAELKRTMRKKNIRALSAPAIGYKKRVFCIDFQDNEIKTFINPIYTETKGLQLSKEVCTSIPGKTYIRPRQNDITVMYQTPIGAIETRQMVGLAAFVFQHEMDHLDGLLLSDVGLEVDDNYDTLTEEEKQEVIEAYLDSLDMRNKEIKKEIENDPELKKLDDAIDFLTKVKTGEVKLEEVEIEVPEEETKESEETELAVDSK